GPGVSGRRGTNRQTSSLTFTLRLPRDMYSNCSHLMGEFPDSFRFPERHRPGAPAGECGVLVPKPFPHFVWVEVEDGAVVMPIPSGQVPRMWPSPLGRAPRRRKSKPSL